MTKAHAERSIIEDVKDYWENNPCNTSREITGDNPYLSPEYFKSIENHRYQTEGFIHSAAQFTLHRGKKVLEIGLGAGTDHVQWARAGADCHGIDLTEKAVELTRKHLSLHGLDSKLQVGNAEKLLFADNYFDLVYSWGVIHHSENPQKIIDEIYRVLAKDGMFIGMLYNRRSIMSVRLWIKYALFKGRPFRSISSIWWNNNESLGTKAYTTREIRSMFEKFREVKTENHLLENFCLTRIPACLWGYVPRHWGVFSVIKATK